ncbi:MAG TPA: hypothetical protein VH141_15435 [Pseudonocardia sp.]|nr:hypothetical protein [Pseudonocardia sp.]
MVTAAHSRSAHHDVPTVQAIALGQGFVLDEPTAAAVAVGAGAALEPFRRLVAGLAADDDPGAFRSLLEREAGR